MGYKGPIRTDTAFHIALIGGLFEKSDEVGVLMVHNISDLVSTGREGKPDGWGLPGGGVAQGRDDSPIEADRNELLAETGLIIEKPIASGEMGRIILESPPNRITGHRRAIRTFNYQIGKMASYTFDYSRGGRVINNHIHTFIGAAKFSGTQLERLMRDRARSFRHSSFAGMQIPFFSVDFRESMFSDSEITELNIEERDEVDAIGIFPYSYLKRLLAVYIERQAAGEPHDFYKGHLQWLVHAMDEYEMKRRVELGREKVWADALKAHQLTPA